MRITGDRQLPMGSRGEVNSVLAWATVSAVIAVGIGGTWWHYVVLFVAVAASWAGVPFVGATVAGAAGLAASQGALDLAAVIIVATAAGEAGGLIGYDIGFRWGRELLDRPGKHQARRQNLMADAERAYAKWGGLAVFLTPAIVSGTARMRHGRFAFWNLIASLGFAVSVTASAYGVGKIATGHHTAHDILVLLIGLASGALIVIVFLRHRRRVRAERERGER
jgi:membrane protein DedA with SNARE-associated domain